MANQPFYHLRPNKCIDRNLFVQTLIGLNQLLPISTYNYTGFGSYLFDDFKLLHETLNISKMISLEKEPAEFERAQFNLPYSCIEVKQTSSTEYLSNLFLDDDAHNIFWLDFVSPEELGTQISDYVTLLNVLSANDIIRITINANPGSLGESDKPTELQAARLENLKARVPDEYLPAVLTPSDVTKKNYPLTLLRILKAATMQCLEDQPPYSPNFLLPLFSSVYADGQQMLTLTGIVLNSHDFEDLVKKALKNYPHANFSWIDPCRIEIPALSTKEILELNKLLPNPEVRQHIEETFPFVFSAKDGQALESYISYYKYYPNYHHVSF